MKENSKRRILIVSAIAIVVVILVVAAIIVNGSGSKNNLRDQLDLAEQYLSDLDYEQAIAAYEQALEIDPKCEEAYLGLADIYVTLEDYEKALKILNEGYERTSSDSIAEKIEEIQNLLAEQEIESEEISEVATEQETEQEGFFSEEELKDKVYVDYTFDLSQFDVSIFGKQIYEWTAEELWQYLIDNNIYDTSKETAYVDPTTGEVWESSYYGNSFYLDGVNYYAHRNEIEMELADSQYYLWIDEYDTDPSYIILSNLDVFTSDEYDRVLDIEESTLGKSLVDFFGDEEFVTAIKNHAMLSEDYYGSEDIEREYVYGNNIRVIGLTDEFNSGDVSTVVIYIPSLDYTFFLGLYDAEIIQIMTEEY